MDGLQRSTAKIAIFLPPSAKTTAVEVRSLSMRSTTPWRELNPTVFIPNGGVIDVRAAPANSPLFSKLSTPLLYRPCSTAARQPCSAAGFHRTAPPGEDRSPL